ncbi:hypothetical protein KAI54_02445 [Candidatus Gracilibacteria bacterium]|nr:hypothetical protein [Candidatus Gracilibacteria bacterium]
MPQINLISVCVKKISRGKAALETLDRKFKFTFPIALLSKNLKMDEQLSLKISNIMNTEDTHDESARKLLEKIIN